MENTIRESLSEIPSKDMAYIDILMEIFMKANGKTTNIMDMAK